MQTIMTPTKPATTAGGAPAAGLARLRRRVLLPACAAALALGLLAPGVASAAPLWSSVPSPFACGPGGKIVRDNSCVRHTGFKPNGRKWWGQARNPKGNCTAYVAYRLDRNGAAQLAASFGNAVGWRAVVRDKLGGKAVDERPAVGSIGWWGASSATGVGPAGHVAYVEKVSADGKTIHLSESHFGIGSRRLTVRKGDAYWPEAFLHIKDQRSSAGQDKRANDPRGHLDAVSSPATGKVRVHGWAFDPDSKKRALAIHAYVGGKAGTNAEGRSIGKAAVRRNDLAKRFGKAVGPHHGFASTFSTTRGGKQPVCVYAIDVGKGANALLGCKTVTIKAPPTGPGATTPVSTPQPESKPAPPKGHFDSVSSPAVGKIRVRGWSFDPNAPAEAVKVHVYVGGKNHKIVTANLKRDDVAKAYATAEKPGPYHGFDTTFSTSLKGKQQVCVYAIDIGSGSNPKLGCKTVTVKAPVPPPRSVTISKGGSAQGKPGCSSSYCRYIVVNFKNFSGASHTITCRASHGSEGGYYTYTRSGSSSTSAVCYYGFPGHSVWVTVDGVKSNRITW